MMTSQSAHTRWMLGRGARWLLIGSLALNLMTLGLVIGAVASGGPGGRFRGIDLATGPLVAALREEDRAAIRDMLRVMVRPRHGEALAQERVAILAALRTAPFDPGALAAALDSMRDRVGAATVMGQAALVARITTMTDTERAEFAERLQETSQEGRD